MILNHCLVPLSPAPAPLLYSVKNSLPSPLTSPVLLVNCSLIHQLNTSAIPGSTERAATRSVTMILELHKYHQCSDLMLSCFRKHNLDNIIDGPKPQPREGTEQFTFHLRQKIEATVIAQHLNASNQVLFIKQSTFRGTKALQDSLENWGKGGLLPQSR